MSVFDDEKHYIAKNRVNVTYLEDPFGIANYKGRQKLLFVFQSLGDENAETDTKKFPWTMVNGFKYLNCRKIYIKDNYGTNGCFYLGMNGKFDVEEAILEFIRSKIVEYEILLDNVMMYGNSKGGYAALNFGFQVGNVNILSAVPVIDLYYFITKHKTFLSYIMTSNVDEKEKTLYSSKLTNLIKTSYYIPDVCLLTSHNDNLFAENIPNLLEALDLNGCHYNVIYNDEYYITRHNEVVKNSLNEVYYCISKWLVN